MKVAFFAPQSIDEVNGGLRQQVLRTTEEIRNSDITVQRVYNAEELHNSEPDILHVFGAGFHTIEMIHAANRANIPVILSPVMFTNHTFGRLKWVLRIIRVLHWVPWIPKNELIVKYQCCKLSKMVLPNTEKESALIYQVFGISESRITVIPNGVEKRFSEGDPKLFFEQYGLKDFILFAGQAGAPRKNVLSLLKAVSLIQKPLVIIGDLGNSEYAQECKKMAANQHHVYLIPSLPHDSDMLRSAYHAAEIFVLPSQFETPGIAAMEAALAGCKIVITERGGTRDYFGDMAEYIDPDSVESITSGIQSAMKSSVAEGLKKNILEEYSWEKAGTMTAEVYSRILKE